MESAPIVVIGAGVAGLACARELAGRGRVVTVLDKARGVGGRCATRRVEGQAVDHGLSFFHGSDAAFLSELEAVPGATVLPGWPSRVSGDGPPCQPQAFAPGERRVGFADGVSAFAKHLARGLDVRLDTRVASVDEARALPAGDPAGTVVLAMPIEQACALLDEIAGGGQELEAARGLLGMMGSLACLTVIAGYAPDVPDPGWDVLYPEDSDVLLLASHDSAKRAAPRYRVLVYQARACWSRRRLEADPASWSAEILAEAGRRVGPWAARPSWHQPHRWRYARVDRGTELSQPMLITLDGGLRIGLAGELFAPGGGVEAAFVSGRRLAGRLLEDGK
ncbi:MAG: FAD-dependent oxidoreductase [Acidobacteria bacterium]|nr:FAD-dependent oxidoreductase [Acidobacteriota bacterium]